MIRWVYAFVDRPSEVVGRAAEFWASVTGATGVSPWRGDGGEFATLLPADGDPWVKLQGVAAGPGGVHLDLAVADVRETVGLAVKAGADVVAEHGEWAVLRSPGGMLFCAVPFQGESRRPEPADGSRLDQVAIDLPADAYPAEVEFWSALTGWEVLTGSRPEFTVVRGPAGLPVRLLLHRLDAARPTGAHLDLACADRRATRAAHERLGAEFVAEHSHWIVMRDPAGGTYCLTARDPLTGSLA
ncbi:VOC family protein [Kitasatospora terrestris]|uniref:Glyoxalase-like domain-containing protein n=1 Tax=Kitasatospora terrestris TaxID=258051 RepID=A0ABP9ESB8_9ACTN